MIDEEEQYTDFSNVETSRNYLIPEQMPEGPYGAPRNKFEPVQNKSTPWRKGQRYYSAFNYENKSLHQHLPRHMEGAHPPHDDPGEDQEVTYQNIPPNT